MAQALGLYKDFCSTRQECGQTAELGLGRSIWRGPKLDEVEEEGVPSFSFPAVKVRV